MRRVIGLLGLLSIGCEPVVEETEVFGVCLTEGPTEAAVVQELVFGRVVDGVSSGTDLDEAVSTLGGGTGCGAQDYVTVDGVAGIDNAMSGLLPILEATEAAALEPLIQQSFIGGEILVVIEMAHLENVQDDECVVVSFLNGDDVPTIGSDGYIEPSQTFAIDWAASGDEVVGSVVDGHLIARDFAFRLPLEIFDFVIELELYESYADLALNEDGSFEGFIAGGFPYAPMIEALEQTAIDKDLMELLPGLFAAIADLGMNDQGQCELVSVVLEVRGTSAFLFPE